MLLTRSGLGVLVLSVAALGQLASAEASAAEVMCSDGPAACTIQNDPGPYFECSCDGAPSSGGTGSSENPWADFTEAELMEVCQMSLPDACPAGDTDVGSGGGDPTDGGTGPVGGTGDNAGESKGSDPGSGSATEGESTEEESDKSCAVTGTRPPVVSLLLIVGAGLCRRRRR